MIIGLLWFWFFRVAIPTDEKRIYTFLITKKAHLPSSNSTLSIFDSLWSFLTPPLEASWLLFYQYPNGKFFLFEIDNNTFIKNPDNTYRNINDNIFFLKENLATYYGVENIDFEIKLNQEAELDFLDKWDGSLFFNLYSTNYPLGEVYINKINYKKFLAGINDPYLRNVTAQSFWLNLLMTFEDNLPHHDYHEIFFEKLFSAFSADFNYTTFETLMTPLLKSKQNIDRLIEENIELRFDKNNIENLGNETNKIFIPYLEGAYDRNKINRELNRMKGNLNDEQDLTITVQIKNATKINFLAARAAGFFRLRGINISEYLRFSQTLDRSVILDYANNTRKRDYIRKITKINRVYHLLNYRENFDFGVYLGQDLYLLQNQTNQNTRN